METNDKTTPVEHQNSYARRPHRKEKQYDKTLKTRNILNITFMVLALIGVIIYLWGDNFIGTIVVLVAMAVKMIESVMRMIR